MPAASKAHGDDLTLSFSNTAGHLDLREGGNAIFETAGESGKYSPTTVEVHGNDLILKGAALAKSVRYGWGAAPSAVLFGADGLPAAPFVFPDTTPVPAK